MAQHADYKYRVCTAAEPISDACDPGPEQVRSNTMSFLVVFIAQILALLLSKVILAWKLRKMVDENDAERRRGLLGVLDANTLLRVEAFTQAEEARALEAQRQKMRNGCVAASVPRYYAAAACRDERKALGGQGDARGGGGSGGSLAGCAGLLLRRGDGLASDGVFLPRLYFSSKVLIVVSTALTKLRNQ